MVILGGSGHAKEIIDVLLLNGFNGDIALFDDVTPEKRWPVLFKDYKRLRSIEELRRWFKNEPSFMIGAGGIKAKHILWKKAVDAGGKPATLQAHNASICTNKDNIDEGCTIMQMVFVSSDVKIGQAVLINARANIHHDVSIGDFSEIAPSALLLGRCHIGKNTLIGAGAIILPDIRIGDDCTIGAGSVVTKNVVNNQLVKGNPAK